MALTKVTSGGLTDDSIVNADINSSAAVALSKLATDPSNATNLASGTVPTARLGSGTASSSTVLYGDQTYKTEPGLTGWTTGGTSNSLIPSATDQGIYLGVSSATASNLLDDYEEGTFTGSIIGTTGSAGSWAVATNDCYYRKVGDMVFIFFKVKLSNKGSYTGDTKCGGLPFTVADKAAAVPATVAAYYVDLGGATTGSHDVYMAFNASDTHAYLKQIQDEAAPPNWAYSNIVDDSALHFMGAYLT
jgi:hypothetical protein